MSIISSNYRRHKYIRATGSFATVFCPVQTASHNVDGENHRHSEVKAKLYGRISRSERRVRRKPATYTDSPVQELILPQICVNRYGTHELNVQILNYLKLSLDSQFSINRKFHTERFIQMQRKKNGNCQNVTVNGH